MERLSTKCSNNRNASPFKNKVTVSNYFMHNMKQDHRFVITPENFKHRTEVFQKLTEIQDTKKLYRIVS